MGASAHPPVFCSHLATHMLPAFKATGTSSGQAVRGTALSLATPHSPRSQWLPEQAVCLGSQHQQIHGAPGKGCSLCVDLRPPRSPERLLVPGTNLATFPSACGDLVKKAEQLLSPRRKEPEAQRALINLSTDRENSEQERLTAIS